MLIYTGNSDGEKIIKCKDLGLGIMISSSSMIRTNKKWSKLSCALDNGAFRCWQRGYPFQEWAFMDQLKACYCNGIDLDFIVCPDIVAGGKRSLDFSLDWISGKLFTVPRLALVVQDGMTIRDVKNTSIFTRFPNVSHIFIGGTEKWKWETAQEWSDFAHNNNKRLHIGRCGTLPHLKRAKEVGADSVDSTSFTRNDSWNIVEEFLNPKQQSIKWEGVS